MPAAKPKRAAAADKPAKTARPADKLAKLGLHRDVDLVLHLPMRYEDETRLVTIASLRDGVAGQVQGTVVDSRIEQRARRQLLVRVDDGSGELLLRLLHFHPGTQKTLAPGTLVRVKGELRAGFFGREMVHPEFRAVQPDTPLPLQFNHRMPEAESPSQRTKYIARVRDIDDGWQSDIVHRLRMAYDAQDLVPDPDVLRVNHYWGRRLSKPLASLRWDSGLRIHRTV